MGTSDVFKTFVEPSLERIPVLEVSHVERHQKRDYIVTQTIQRNVFTDFDRKLSRHLAATRGAGFPAFTVAVRVNERSSGGPPRYLTPADHASVPHALKGIADRAFAHCGRVDLTVYHNDPGAGDRVDGVRREVGADDMEALDAALDICRYLGEAEFLDISGDFDIVIAAPPGESKPIVMHLRNCSISMPCTSVSVRLCRPTVSRRRQLRSVLSVTPRHELVETRDLMVGDAAESVGEPCLRVDAVQLGGLDQRIGDGGGSSASL